MLNFIIDNEVVLSAYKYDVYNNICNDDTCMFEVRSLTNMNNTLIDKFFYKKIENLVIAHRCNTYFLERCYVETEFYYDMFDQSTNIVLKIFYNQYDLKVSSTNDEFTYKQIIRNNKIKNLLEE